MRLKTDMACDLDWQAAGVGPEDPARLVPFFENMEFRTLAREMTASTRSKKGDSGNLTLEGMDV